MGLFDSTADDKTETIRRLTLALATANEQNQQLQEQNRAAVGARKGAVERVRELEDVLRMKERMTEDMERQVEGSRVTMEELKGKLSDVERQLQAFRDEQASFPLSDMDLLARYQRQIELFDLIQEALSCAICYSPYAGKGKDGGQPISLMCGHSFCEACFSQWEAKHLAAFKTSNQQGAYTGAECPECRSANVRKGRVRVWAMEEVVRLVERGAKEAEIPYTPASAATAAAVAPRPPKPAPAPTPPPPSASREDSTPLNEVTAPIPEQFLPVLVLEEVVQPEPVVEVDEDAASILRPRRSTPYGQVLR